MKITIKLTDRKGSPINGVVQVGPQAIQTVDGLAAFDDMDEGTYVIRGLARGYHLESNVVDLTDGDLNVVIEAR